MAVGVKGRVWGGTVCGCTALGEQWQEGTDSGNEAVLQDAVCLACLWPSCVAFLNYSCPEYPLATRLTDLSHRAHCCCPQEKNKRETELRNLAMQARMERQGAPGAGAGAGGLPPPPPLAGRGERIALHGRLQGTKMLGSHHRLLSLL